MGNARMAGRLWRAHLPKSVVPVIGIEQRELFDRESLYQNNGVDYPDNLKRFSFLSQAALEMLSQIGWHPDIIHAHDWQAALACAHIAFGPYGRMRQTAGLRTVLTIHNLAYQGLFGREQWALTGLPESAYGIDGLEFYGKINCLKGGLLSAHAVTTVSPTYAEEIQTPEEGCGLDGVLRHRRESLMGILNGIDTEEWNPRTDKALAARYSSGRMAGKSLCKLALQRAMGLPQRQDMLIGMVQRLAEQKGFDIVLEAMDSLMALPIQLVVLGTGDPVYERQLQERATQFPHKLAVRLHFDNALAHQIEAGADAFLMPSRFEPCGLNQMYSMRYGTVPIVRKIGGLADTVSDVEPRALKSGLATGIVFEPYTARAMHEAVRRAVAAYANDSVWSALVRNCMCQDFSWGRSAEAYVGLYERLRLTAPRE
jgi:starch synthase